MLGLEILAVLVVPVGTRRKRQRAFRSRREVVLDVARIDGLLFVRAEVQDRNLPRWKRFGVVRKRSKDRRPKCGGQDRD
jgi:hypothetical protein